MKFDNILVLSPHTDDAELGCGGALDKFQKNGSNIHFITFSSADDKNLIPETKESIKVLGIKKIKIFEFPVRNFFLKRQEILDYLYNLSISEKIDLVLTPSTRDLHQDHQVISQETIRAFKLSTIWGYELPWNHIIFQTNCFIELSRENIQQKVNALKCYKSQQYRDYFKEDFIWSIARTRGVQIRVEFAEAFELIKLVITD